jgi:hypothetical protein
MSKLNKREAAALKDISTYTRSPSSNRHGYSKYWTPKTNESLAEKGMVEFIFASVVITDAGIKWLSINNT